MKFTNYKSSFDISKYTLGKVYAFYVRNNNADRFNQASPEVITKYASAITEVVNTNNACAATDGKWLSFTRVLGVVVEKHKADHKCNVDYLTVMFRTSNDCYVLNNYAVGIDEVFVNRKDDVLPAAVLRL